MPEALRAVKLEGASFEADRHLLLPRPAHHRAQPRPRLGRLRDRLFVTLARNSADPSEVFAIPPGQVVEMGVQVAV